MKAEIENKHQEMIDKLTSFFQVKIAGSFQFYQEGLLDFSDLGDIDLLVKESLREGVEAFLKSEGFEEIKKKDSDGYRTTWKPTSIFRKKNYKDFHLMPAKVAGSIVEVYSSSQIIKEKFERSRFRDLEQIKKIVSRKLHSSKEQEND